MQPPCVSRVLVYVPSIGLFAYWENNGYGSGPPNSATLAGSPPHMIPVRHFDLLERSLTIRFLFDKCSLSAGVYIETSHNVAYRGCDLGRRHVCPCNIQDLKTDGPHRSANQASPTCTMMHVHYMRRGTSDVSSSILNMSVSFVHLQRLRTSRRARAEE